MKNIRNFCIIAHIDHGKSTLADRLLEYTKTVEAKDMQDQLLDDMDLERERGITIKSHAIQMNYTYKGEEYILNLIDTPGHVDFSYEVSRSIAACEGALLIVDASQGIQAQTISNLYMAIENDLEIIPVLNKIDLPSARPEEVEDQIVELLGCPRGDILRASGKTGEGVMALLDAIVEKVPAPSGDPEAPLQCLIFDSVFNSFRGIIAYYKVVNGVLRKGDRVKFINTGKEYDADEVGVLKLDMSPRDEIRTGDVGYIISGIKTSKEVRVGDTITHVARPAEEAIAGFEEVKPMVFAGVYPIDNENFENLRASLEKLQLNDASLTFQPESSAALGFAAHGNRAGAARPRVQHGRHHDRPERVLHRPYEERGGDRGAQPGQPARPHPYRPHRRAFHPCVGHHEHGFYRSHHDALPRQTRCAHQAGIHIGRPGGDLLRPAAGRDRDRFLRQAEEHLKGLRLVRLPLARFPPEPLGEARHPAEWRAGRRAVHLDAYRQQRTLRPSDVREVERVDSSPAVRHRDPGGHRLEDYRPRDGQGRPQGRDRQVLRRRYLA